MRKFNSQEIKEFVSKPLFDERVILKKDPSYPKISIVTPSYNQAEFLERTILSILNQNYPNLEYIIIDGGSTDGSVEIIKKYEKYLTYWVSEKDKGQSEALNKGFTRSTGHLIGCQNSDDIYLPGSFYKVAEVFKENPNVDIIFGNRLDVDEQDDIIGESRFTPFTVVGHWYEGMSLSIQSAFWQREVFSKIGMMDINFQIAMDWEFFLKAGLNKLQFKHVRFYFGAIRRHQGTKTATLSLEQVLKEREWAASHYGYGKKNGWVFPYKTYALFRRVICYFLQGDWDYLFRGIKRRIEIKLRKGKGD